MGICNANLSLVMKASYSTILLEQPLVRERGYGMRALFGESTLFLSQRYHAGFLSFPLLISWKHHQNTFPILFKGYGHDLFIYEVCSLRRDVGNGLSSQEMDKCLTLYHLLGYVLDFVCLSRLPTLLTILSR